MRRQASRKRPCKICRRWFEINPRQKGKQETCEREECQRERHRRNCKEWHEKNKGYDQENRLRNRLKKGKEKEKYMEPLQRINKEAAVNAVGQAVVLVVDEMIKEAVEIAKKENERAKVKV